MDRTATRSGRRPYILLGTLAVLVAALSGAILPRPARASNPTAASAIAHVRYIRRGLTVQPPHANAGKGRVKQSLFTQYSLQTRQKQKASIDFQDGSLLNMNQLTAAVLRSPAVTQVKSGEVEEQVVPGTNHQVQTAAAVASAVGTVFDVRVQGNVTTITVIEGAVLVQTAQGNILVTSGERVRISKGKAPPQPAPANGAAATGWASSIPGPSTPLGTNIALAANGGQIYRWTSQRDDPSHAFAAGNADDGSTQSGWQSAPGQTSEQSLWVRFQGLKAYTITGILLDCAATGGEDPANAAQDFTVLASNDPSDAGSGFSPIVSGTCGEQNGIQMFPLSQKQDAADARTGAQATVQAKALQFEFKNNHGGKDGIAVAEIGVIGQEQPAVLGTPTPEPTDTPIPTSTPTPTEQVLETPSLSGPAAVDFGAWLYNQTSPARAVTIVNNGSVATTVQRLDLQEQYQTIFNIVGDTCTGATLQPGASCTASLTFNPYDLGSTQGALLVTYSGSGTRLSIPLSGHGFYLLLTAAGLKASWTSPLPHDQYPDHLLMTKGSFCATFDQVGFDFTLDDNNMYGQHAESHGTSAPLKDPIPASGYEYDNPDGSLIWKAQAYITILGVPALQPQLQYTAQITGSGSTFQILTPLVTPATAQVDQCPAGIQPVGRAGPAAVQSIRGVARL